MNRTVVKIALLGFLFSLMRFAQAQNISAYQHQALTLDFKHQSTSETESYNPFLNFRLQVLFTKDDTQMSVPGYFAADGQADTSGAKSGAMWRVKFTPPSVGTWQYEVSFTEGPNVAIIDDPRVGKAVAPHHGQQGYIDVLPVPHDATGFAKKGRIVHGNTHYLHTQDGKPLLLFGANSPENFLAYADFDGTYSYNPEKQFLKTWAPHTQDWNEGDPSWGKKAEKGKGIIGALNYLASKNMNVVFALVNNIEGDAQDVWPWISHKKQDYTRYDVSKLAQWERVFAHAESLSIVMMLAFQEQENQLILDDGNTGIERRLFLREMISRFGHLKNIIWNIGEEHGGQHAYWPQGQNEQQRFATIRYLKDNDPYKAPIVMGTYANEEEREEILKGLLRFDRFNGISLQSGKMEYVHKDIKRWLKDSAQYNRPWLVMQDELGPWHTGTKPDIEDPKHNEIRKNVLWGALTAGASGVQWYFGWLTPPHDLNAEDWRSRNNVWEQSAVARTFFEKIDFVNMRSSDELIDTKDAYCFSKEGDTYVVYLKEGGSAKLDLSNQEGEYSVHWYNPRKQSELRQGNLTKVKGGEWVDIGNPPEDQEKDWVALIRLQL